MTAVLDLIQLTLILGIVAPCTVLVWYLRNHPPSTGQLCAIPIVYSHRIRTLMRRHDSCEVRPTRPAPTPRPSPAVCPAAAGRPSAGGMPARHAGRGLCRNHTRGTQPGPSDLFGRQ